MNAKDLKSILENPANAKQVQEEESTYRLIMGKLLNAATSNRKSVTLSLFSFPSAVQHHLEQDGFNVTLVDSDLEFASTYKVSF